VALDKNGNVWTWGDNLYGQLGLGYTGKAVYTPAKVSIDNVKMVVAGRGYTAVLKNDGTVWAWGENALGMTGDSSTANTLWPVQVQGLSDIVEIDAGMDHTLALKSDGTVWAWGDGKENILCNGQGYTSTVFVNVPVKVNDLPKVADIVAADFCSAALGSDGNVYVWGSNGDGQYGNGIDLWTPAQTPQKVPGIGDVASITASLGHCVAVKKDGSVWAWGRNQENQVQPGKGKKVLSPLKKIDGSAPMPTQNPNASPTAGGQQQTTPGGSASNGDLTLYITAGGVVLLVLAVIGAIFLIRMRRD
jgi:alpha-tubulin suppressor-like RCC1 family protein